MNYKTFGVVFGLAFGLKILIGAAGAQSPPSIRIASLAERVTFATHGQLQGHGFAFGPSDGQFGAMPNGGSSYRFFGAAGSSPSCPGRPAVHGSAFAFSGTLDRFTGGDGCRPLFGPGDGPTGWLFDKDYAGGGQVVRFATGSRRARRWSNAHRGRRRRIDGGMGRAPGHRE